MYLPEYTELRCCRLKSVAISVKQGATNKRIRHPPTSYKFHILVSLMYLYKRLKQIFNPPSLSPSLYLSLSCSPYTITGSFIIWLTITNVTCSSIVGSINIFFKSSLQGRNLEALCEAVMTQAEVLELNADQSGLVEGVIVECKVDKGMG